MVPAHLASAASPLPQASDVDLKEQEIKLYSYASPYMEESLPQRKKTVRELSDYSLYRAAPNPLTCRSRWALKAEVPDLDLR